MRFSDLLTQDSFYFSLHLPAFCNRGDLLPEDKIDVLRDLLQSHSHAGMIGDGVNDAPAMATATIGISMGAAGTDTGATLLVILNALATAMSSRELNAIKQ